MFYKQLSNSYGPISPQKTWVKCSRFDEKPAEITNSCEMPGYPAVKLSSTNFQQIFPAVLPGKGYSGSMTLLKVVLCQENDPFSQPRDWIEVSKCWTLAFWHLGQTCSVSILSVSLREWSSRRFSSEYPGIIAGCWLATNDSPDGGCWESSVHD